MTHQFSVKKYKKLFAGALSICLLFLFDQFTKRLAVLHLKDAPAVPIISGVFELSYLENHGAAFGILQGQKTFLILTTSVTLLILIYLFFRLPEEKHYFYLHLLLVLLISGAIGNFADRCAHDYVIDFFYFKLIDFPVFNVADTYVTVAAALLFLLFFFYYKEEDLDFLFARICFWKKGEKH